MADQDMSDDERLSAWLDGELPDGEAKRLEERLTTEPALARRLERLREADRTAGQAFHAIDGAPMPRSVLELLKDENAGRSQDPEEAKVVRLRPRAPRFFQMPVAIAASVALVAGFLIHDLIAPQGGGDDAALPISGVVASDSGLYRMLEAAPAGEPVDLGDGSSAEVILTFQAKDGDWCRQFRLGTAAAALHGLACRQPGGWQLETASFAGPDPSGATFQQAAGATPAALEAAVRARLGGGEPLGPGEESLVISEGWKK
jgi:negative regulator of sigma E activity